jgi:hypothetical protein
MKTSFRFIAHQYRTILEEYAKIRYTIDDTLPMRVQTNLLHDIVINIALKIKKLIDEGVLDEKPEGEDPIIFALGKI